MSCAACHSPAPAALVKSNTGNSGAAARVLWAEKKSNRTAKKGRNLRIDTGTMAHPYRRRFSQSKTELLLPRPARRSEQINSKKMKMARHKGKKMVKCG